MSNEEEEARYSLVEIYNSKSVAHGTYIIAIAVGIFAFLQIVLPIEPGISLKAITAASVLSMFFILGGIIIFQTSYWGSIAPVACFVPAIDKNELPDWARNLIDSGEAKPTALWRLNAAACQHMEKYHPNKSMFAGKWLSRPMVYYLLLLWFGLSTGILGLLLLI